MPFAVRSLSTALALSLALTPLAHARTSKHVEENCRGALAARGYPGFNLDNSRVRSSRSGWSMQ